MTSYTHVSKAFFPVRCHTFLRHRRNCNFIYAHKNSSACPAPVSRPNCTQPYGRPVAHCRQQCVQLQSSVNCSHLSLKTFFSQCMNNFEYTRGVIEQYSDIALQQYSYIAMCCTLHRFHHDPLTVTHSYHIAAHHTIPVVRPHTHALSQSTMIPPLRSSRLHRYWC